VLDPLIRWAWFSVGIGITSNLTVRGRRSGHERSVLVGLLRVQGAWYVGHPNGDVGWTANLRDAGRARIAPRPESSFEVTAVPLADGPERTAVIRATAEQQPFPGNVLYRAARRHILSEGRYFRIEPA
jgi:deazaflavin-dependent oxidoreductase (nitroreductase family)